MLRRIALLLLFALASLAGAAGPSVFPRHRRALVVGVGTTPGMGDLAYATADARGFAATLRDDLKFSPDEVRVLTTDASEGGQAPTHANILAALDAQLNDPTLGKGELFVVYFSGHGVGTPGGDYLMPSDGHEEQIATEGVRVNDVLERITAHGLKNVLIVADACRAGDKNPFGSELVDQARKANIALLLGCAPGNRSYEIPRLKHGVFTYYLLKAIDDDANLDEYGALWTSRIASVVGTKVQEYTESEHPDDPQLPGGWADPARDVMLRATPKAFDLGTLDKIAQNPRGLTPEMYAASTSELMYELFLKDRLFEAIRLGKALDALGLSDDQSLVVMAGSLLSQGREGEADPLLARLAKSENPEIADWAVAINPSPIMAPAAKVAAALRLWQRRPDETNALTVWAILKLHTNGPEYRTFLAEAERRLPPDSRSLALVRADLAIGATRLDEAAGILLAALDLPEGLLGDDAIVSILAALDARRGDAEALEALTAKMSARHPENGGTLARIALSWKALGQRDRAIATAQTALERGGLDESQAESCFFAAGYRAGELADALEALARTRPFDWRTRMHALIARSARTGTAIDPETITREISVYGASDLAVESAFFAACENVLTDAITAGVRKPEEITPLALIASSVLKSEVPLFARDGDLWEQLTRLSLVSGDDRAIQTLFAKAVGAPQPGDSASLGGVRLTLAIAEDDPKAMASAWRTISGTEPERSNLGWTYAAALFARGDVSEARSVAATIADPAPGMARFARATRLALKGDRAKLRAYAPEDFTDAAIVGIALARMGDDARTDELLMPSLRSQTWLSLPVSAAAVRILQARAKAKGDLAGFARIGYTSSVSFIGSGAFAGISVLPQPKIAAYAARYAGETALVDLGDSDDDSAVPGTVVAQARADGGFTLRFQPRDGEPLTARGTFDANGNLRAEMAINGKPWKIRAKLVPPTLWKEIPATAQFGQVLSLCGPEGQWAILQLKSPEGATGSNTGPKGG